MFRIASIIGISVAIVFSLGALVIKRKSARKAAVKGNWLVDLAKKLTVVFGLLSAVILIMTGFAQEIISGVQIHGYLLMLHTTAAPVFMVCVAAMAVLWADSAKLSCADCCLMRWLAGEKVKDDKSEAPIAKHIGFWAILLLTMPVALSMILSMLPIFGSHMQEILFTVHQWSALLLAMAIIIEVNLVRR